MMLLRAISPTTVAVDHIKETGNEDEPDMAQHDLQEVSVGVPVAEHVQAIRRPSFIRRVSLRFSNSASAKGGVVASKNVTTDTPVLVSATRVSGKVAATRRPSFARFAKTDRNMAGADTNEENAPQIIGTCVSAATTHKVPTIRRSSFARFAKTKTAGSTTRSNDPQAIRTLQQEEDGHPQILPSGGGTDSWTEAAKQAVTDAWWARRDRELRATPGVC